MEKRDIKTAEKYWGQFEITEKEIYFWHIGELRLWCKRTVKEIQIAFTHITSPDEELYKSNEPPENIAWSRWALNQKSTIIELNPQFPDRPVVVKPETSFSIGKNSEARIYIRVPLWVRIESTTKPSATLLEIPTVILSNTWFGTFFEGELCYWISSGAQRKIESDPVRPYLAISPNQLVNQSKDAFLVEKICLRVSFLSLFSDGEQLWSDETKIVYKGNSGVSSIKASGVPPSEVPAAQLISSPRNPIKKSLIAKTFSSLKDFPGLGIPTS